MADSKVVLITGGNRGLGLEVVRALLSSDHTFDIIVGSRALSKAEEVIATLVSEDPTSSRNLSSIEIDVEDDKSIDSAYAEVVRKHGRLDVLINNAGITTDNADVEAYRLGAQLDQQLASERMTMREMWNASWNVNTTSAQVVTATFIPLLLQSEDPRLLFITSGTSTLSGSDNLALAVNKPSPKGWPKGNFDGKSFNVPAYRSSKTGLNMMMREWHRSLLEDGVKVWSVSPGFLATGLGGGSETNRSMGAIDPSIGGRLVCSVVEGQRDSDVGKVVLRDGVQAW